MKITYSKRFVKQAEKLDDITKKLLANSIKEAKSAVTLSSISICIKMSGYKNVYRIRISDHRAIFIHENDDELFFQFIASRGDVYDKKYRDSIKGK